MSFHLLTLFAYTAPGGLYPGYVSINRLENGDVRVTVRGEPCIIDETRAIMGQCAAFVVPAAEWPMHPYAGPESIAAPIEKREEGQGK
jgi:hypothetical protein